MREPAAVRVTARATRKVEAGAWSLNAACRPSGTIPAASHVAILILVPIVVVLRPSVPVVAAALLPAPFTPHARCFPFSPLMPGPHGLAPFPNH
eukprot:scaffold2111_cov130-Isochrysis_galbana.AAC.9